MGNSFIQQPFEYLLPGRDRVNTTQCLHSRQSLFTQHKYAQISHNKYNIPEHTNGQTALPTIQW